MLPAQGARMMRTAEEYQAKADQMDALADASLTAAEMAQYRELAASWRILARQAAMHHYGFYRTPANSN